MINFHAGSLVVRIVADATRFHAGILGAGAGVSRLGLEAGRAAAVLTTVFTPATNRAAAGVGLLQANLLRLGWTMTSVFGGPFALFGAASAKAFSDFDKGMNDAIAAAGGVSFRIRNELEKSIFEISSRSITSSAQMAESYYYSISAGLSAAQAQASLGHLENFSVGGRLNINTAADMLNDIQFSLNLVDENINQHAANVQRITDVIAMASVRSNATIEQIATSLVNKSATAMRLFNITLEEGTAALMVYAQQGTKAEVAGERLSIVLRDLQAVNITARAAWEAAGLSVYDATGKMRPLADIIGMLEDRMRGFSDEQKRALLLALEFPSRSVHALLPLIGKSREIEEFHRMLVEESAGFNRDIAEMTRRSFAAQVRIFWNNVVNAAIEAGRALVPILMAINFQLKTVADWWLKIDQSTRKGIVAFMGLMALTGPLAMLASYVVSIVAPLFTVMGILGAIGTILTTGGLVIATALLVRHFGGLGPVLEQASTFFGRFMENVGNFMLHFNENVDVLTKYFQDHWLSMLRNVGIAVVAFVGAAFYWIGGLLTGIGMMIGRLMPEILASFAVIGSGLLMALANISQAAIIILGRLMYNIGVLLGNGLVFFAKILTSFFLDGGLAKILGALSPYISLIFHNILHNFNVMIGNMHNAVVRAFGGAVFVPNDRPFRNLLDGSNNEMAANFKQAFADVGRNFRTIWREQWQETTRWLINLVPDEIQWLFPWQGIGDVLVQGWTLFTDAIAEDMPNLIRMFEGLTFPFQRIVDQLGGWSMLPTPALNLNRHPGIVNQDFNNLAHGQLLTTMGGFNALGNVANEIQNNWRATQGGQLLGLGLGSGSAGHLAALAASMGQFSSSSRGHLPGDVAPFGSIMSSANFQEISTRRFALDGEFGLANTSTQKVGVRDDETHRLLEEIINGNNGQQRAPVVRRRN